MSVILLNVVTIITIFTLGLFSVRRLVFILTTLCTEIDWSKRVAFRLPSVTVLIPCHNEESVITGTLDALLALDYPSDKLEIVVIDDHSTDDTLRVAEKYEKQHPFIHVFKRSNSRRGKAVSLNEAVRRYSFGDVVYFLDADHRPKTDALARLVRHLSDPGIGVVNGRSIPWNRHETLVASYGYLESLVHNRVTMYASDKLGLAPAIMGSNFCIRRSLLREIGWFNEERLIEDFDLTVAIYNHGCRIKYDLTSITEHEVPETINGYILQHLRWNRGFNEVTKKHWLKILLNKEMPVFRRVDEAIVSLGYLDRIFFCMAFGLTLFSVAGTSVYTFPYGVWALFAGLPAAAIGVALIKDNAPVSLYLRLPFVLAFFSIDIYVAIKAVFQDYAKTPTQWQKTARRDDHG